MKENLKALREIMRELRKHRYASTDLVSKLVRNVNELVEFDETHIHTQKEGKKFSRIFEVEWIIGVVCEVFGCTEQQIKTENRLQDIAHARHLIVYILRTENKMSLWSCGDVVNRNHATAISSCKKVLHLEKNNIEFRFKKERVYEILTQ